MASYWKSNPRYFCETCKCWLSDNKASIEFHERGKSHKEKKEKQIAALRKRSAAEFKDQQKAGQYLREMEDAALLAYKKDLAKRGAVLDNTMPDLAGSRPSTGLHEYHFIDDPSKKKKIKIHNADEFKKKSKTLCWTKQVSPEGREYYWNSETGISQWEKPEGYVDIFPPNPTGESSSNLPGASRSSKNLKSSWIKQVSPDGDTYYWNTETGTSRWEKPEGFIEKSEGNSKTDLQGNKSGEISGKAPVEEAKSLWTEEVSPEGRTYYWNKESGKSQWEKPDDYIPPKTEFTPVVDDKDGEEPGESPAPAKKPRHNPYGVWTTVQQPKTTRNINWQLPVKPPDCAKEGVVDRTALENSYEPEPQKFNEKIVTSLGDDEGGSTVFKKKKSKQRSIRKRNDGD